MKVLVEKELECLEGEGIIEPVAFSEWAPPIISVLMADKTSVQICGNFKVMVNKASKLDQYPIPWLEDLFVSLASGRPFTKLDLSQSYQQIRLEEQSWQYVVVNTHKGVYRYTRLPYGVSSALAIFKGQWIHCYNVFQGCCLLRQHPCYRQVKVRAPSSTGYVLN